MAASNNSQKLAVFDQIDTWFFRESRPHGSFGANALSSVFPPPTRTLMGAVRSHIGNHFFANHSDKSWHDLDHIDELKAVIGNSNYLGDVQPRGVFLAQSKVGYQTDAKSISRYYLPSPINVCTKTEVKEQGSDVNHYFTLVLSDKPYQTDAGNIYLPSLPQTVDKLDDLRGAKPLEGAWLSTQAWEHVLNGEVEKLAEEEYFVKQSQDFINTEYRLGIQVNSRQRSVVEGQLYQTNHIRLDPSVSIVMPLTVNEQSLSQVVDPGFLMQSSLLRLGGEGRMANLTVVDASSLAMPKAPNDLLSKTKTGKYRFMIYLLTKLKMPKDQWFPLGFTANESGWQGEIRGIPVHIISACVAKAHREGGWDQKKHKPRAIENYLPSGSVFFVEVEDSISSEALIDKLHGKSFFADDEWGEGLMLLGKYQQ